MSMMPMQPAMQQPAPQFAPHPGPYNAAPPYAPQPQAPHQAHYQSPAHLAPAYDPHLRQVHPSTVATNSRPPMAPAPAHPHPLASAPMPHPTANPSNMYNPPRAPEVYTLSADADAAIPKEVKEQFQCDENGRLLWFTAPPVYNPGRSSEVVALRSGVSRHPDIKDIRAERRAKREARDKALADKHREAEDAATTKRMEHKDKIIRLKRQLLNKEAVRELLAQHEIQALLSNPEALEKWAFAFKEVMDEDTKAIYKDAGVEWEPQPN